MKIMLPHTALILFSLVLCSPAYSQGYKLMRQDRWGDRTLFESKDYPKLAGLAQIEGDVLTAVTINQDGKADKSKAVSGPPQLRAWAEGSVRKIKFEVTSEDGLGPWLFFLTFHFDLKTKTVTGRPASKSDIPNDVLKPAPKAPGIAT